MKVKDLVRLFVKGGIISPGDFLKVLLTAEKFGAEYIRLGSRQDILFKAKENDPNAFQEAFEAIHTEHEINTFAYQNISSSYVAQDILPGKKWLASHIYHYVLNSFDYRTKLRINVVDPSQSLVPLFTGQINFIASGQENFWYVYFRFSNANDTPWQMPMLVYTDDLVKVARAIEQEDFISKQWNYEDIFTFLSENVKMNTQPVTGTLVLPETHFPYYEGINRMPDGKYWIGLYWRDNKYRISILKAIMERCIESEVGKVSLTPWKSFVIKGIFEKDLIGWEKLMGKFGMNMRHSALELNWHLPALDQDALELKFYLVRELDKLDISTYGLTFTIKTSDDITLFTSVVIEKCNDAKDTDCYNLLHSKNFNPNLTDYTEYAHCVHKSVLASLIVELSLLYFENMNEDKVTSPRVQSIRDKIDRNLYQCNQCQTIYDQSLGDLEAGAPAGTPFTKLPATYSCPTCGGDKKGYNKMSLKSI